MIDVEKATEEFRQRLESGYFDEDVPLSGKEIDDVLKAVNAVQKHQSNDGTGYDEGYKYGLNEAWELVQKIVAMNNRELADCKFEVNIKYPDHINAVNIIADNSVNEALEKIKAYDRRIEVGDEVYFSDSKHKRVVTAIIDGAAVQFTETGKWAVDDVDKLHKTGKHYDIQSILDRLKED